MLGRARLQADANISKESSLMTEKRGASAVDSFNWILVLEALEADSVPLIIF